MQYVIKTVCHLQRDRRKCLNFTNKQHERENLIHANQPLTSTVLVGFSRHPVNKRLNLANLFSLRIFVDFIILLRHNKPSTVKSF